MSEKGTGQSDSFSVADTKACAVTVYVRLAYSSGGAGAHTLSLGW